MVHINTLHLLVVADAAYSNARAAFPILPHIPIDKQMLLPGIELLAITEDDSLADSPLQLQSH